MKNEPDIFIRVGWWTRFKLLSSRLRRLFDNWFRRRRVRENLARRRGECRRCGACCRMGVRCRFLSFDDKGLAVCGVYEKRQSLNCHNFPMSERDIAERDLVCRVPCGFTFEKPPNGKPIRMQQPRAVDR